MSESAIQSGVNRQQMHNSSARCLLSEYKCFFLVVFIVLPDHNIIIQKVQILEETGCRPVATPFQFMVSFECMRAPSLRGVVFFLMYDVIITEHWSCRHENSPIRKPTAYLIIPRQ
jgi:hypothetical protein